MTSGNMNPGKTTDSDKMGHGKMGSGKTNPDTTSADKMTDDKVPHYKVPETRHKGDGSEIAVSLVQFVGGAPNEVDIENAFFYGRNYDMMCGGTQPCW